MRKMKTKKKGFTQIQPFFCPDLGEDQKNPINAPGNATINSDASAFGLEYPFDDRPRLHFIMKTKIRNSSLRISPFFCPKLGEDQNKPKKRSSLRFSPVFGPKLGEDLLLKFQKGGYNSVLHTILTYLCIPSTPKEGPWHNAPPPIKTPLEVYLYIYNLLLFSD